MINLDGISSRQREILQQLTERGFVSTTEMANMLSVSDMTIRRDTKDLARRGIVRLVHGGGILPHGAIHTAGFAQRANEDADAKERIALACQRLIAEDDTLLIDAGTTSFEVAHRLPSAYRGTIITHSAPVIQHSLRLRLPGTICLGGELIIDSQALIGNLTVSALKGLRAQTAFIGASGVSAQGLYIDRDLELPTKRAIVAAAERVVLVATSSKMNRSALVYLGNFSALDVLVTDAPLPVDIAEAVRQANVTVVIAT
ncbi:MAG: DeoR/GlpR transcriptional regulator [Acidobacteria bacterium]|nr:DeoR/GlpR transcriptional regulator [Acidobacteriota bacterium]